MKENKTKLKNQRKEDIEKRKKRWIIIGMIVFTAVSFIIADLYYSVTKQPQIQYNLKNPIDKFFEMNFKADNMIFAIKNFTNEYYIFPTGNQRFDWQTLQSIKNISSKGIENVEIEFIKDRGIGFKFKINKTANLSEEEILDDIYDTYKYIINIDDKNQILKIYEGYILGLPQTKENEVYVFALPSIKIDYIIGNLYSRNDSTVQIGIQTDIIEECNNVSANVLNVTSVNVNGEIYDLKFLENITLNNLKVENPKIVNISNESLVIKELAKLNPEIQIYMNSTIMKFKNFAVTLNISNLTTSYVEGNVSENKTNTTNNKSNENIVNSTTFITSIADKAKILNFEYNSSKKEIEEILKNVTYNITPGKISFKIAPEFWNDNFYDYIKKNIVNLKVEKEGKVKVKSVCIVEKKLIGIPNNENFNAILNLDTKEGDKINVNIVYYSISGGGEDKLVPYIAIEKFTPR